MLLAKNHLVLLQACEKQAFALVCLNTHCCSRQQHITLQDVAVELPEVGRLHGPPIDQHFACQVATSDVASQNVQLQLHATLL